MGSTTRSARQRSHQKNGTRRTNQSEQRHDAISLAAERPIERPAGNGREPENKTCDHGGIEALSGRAAVLGYRLAQEWIAARCAAPKLMACRHCKIAVAQSGGSEAMSPQRKPRSEA